MTRAVLVNPSRELIFAGAAFAGDQYGGGGARYFVGKFEDVLGRGIRGNPGNGCGGTHDLTLALPQELLEIFEGKSEEHSQEWLCHKDKSHSRVRLWCELNDTVIAA